MTPSDDMQRDEGFTEEEILRNLLDEQELDEDEPVELDEHPSVEDAEDALPEKPSLDALKAALELTDGVRPDPTIIYGLSGLSQDRLDAVKPVWTGLTPNVRRKVFRSLVEASETIFQLEYRLFAIYALEDDDPGVREAAVDILWEDQSLEVMNWLVHLAEHDEVREVRAAAASGLGRFVLMSELDELPEEDQDVPQLTVIRIWQSQQEDMAVRRRALEAMANCGADLVPQAISEAYNSDHWEMRQSAIYAMGRSCDPQWREVVLTEIESDDPALRYEAARAAGELELTEAVTQLGQLTFEQDRDIVGAAVWSLGEIGGQNAVRILEALADKAEEAEDNDLLAAAEDAINNATLLNDLPDVDL